MISIFNESSPPQEFYEIKKRKLNETMQGIGNFLDNRGIYDVLFPLKKINKYVKGKTGIKEVN